MPRDIFLIQSCGVCSFACCPLLRELKDKTVKFNITCIQVSTHLRTGAKSWKNESLFLIQR